MLKPRSILSPLRARLVLWLCHFWPESVGINAHERLRFISGATLGVLVTAVLSRWWMGSTAPGSWMAASLGASALLMFGMPSSPLAQPWPVLGGNILSALVGAACAALVPDPAFAGAMAVGLSIAFMVPLRCLHPPGGGIALAIVLSAEANNHGLSFANFAPLVLNVLVLLAVAVPYNSLTGRRYPHPQRIAANPQQAAGAFIAADVDAALMHYNQVLDVSRADLENLLQHAGMAAFQRTLGNVKCADIMSQPPLAVGPSDTLRHAWMLMRSQRIKALPVIDAQQQVTGIVTVADFMRLSNLDVHEGLGYRLRALIMGRAKQPSTVAHIMSYPVQTAQMVQHAMDLIPVFSHSGHHHIPIVDADARLTGIITQTDLVRTLAAALQGLNQNSPHHGNS